MSEILGLNLEPKDLGVLQVCLRGILVFLTALAMVRVADRRFLAKMSAFDVILGFVLASTLARAINGSAPFVPTLVVGFVLVLLHRFLGSLSFYSDRIGRLVKGEPHVVVEDGRRNEKRLRSEHITDKDLHEEIRLNGRVSTLEEVRLATLERNGKISVVPR